MSANKFNLIIFWHVYSVNLLCLMRFGKCHMGFYLFFTYNLQDMHFNQVKCVMRKPEIPNLTKDK